jgi:predicted nucleotidyltransferase
MTDDIRWHRRFHNYTKALQTLKVDMNTDTTSDAPPELPFGLSLATLQKIRNTLAQHPRVQRAVVYGSRAKGNYKPGSDIDLTLYAVPGTSLDYRELGDIADEIDDLLLPYMVDLSVFDHIDNAALREHIERVGRVLYERETFVQT